MEHSSKNHKPSEQLVEEAKQNGTSIDAVLLLETILLEEIEAAKQNEQNEQKR